MGKFLRPRRGNINEAVTEDITLYKGEIFLEYPEGRGIGKSPGRIIIGTGDDSYRQKENITDDPTIYQPFITDPSIYSPIYNDSKPSEDYRYDDDDRGASIISNMINRATKLPAMLGWIKKVLCKHTDNLRYDNERIKNLEQATILTDILDIKTKSIIIDPPHNQSYMDISAEVDEGYEFFKWEQIACRAQPQRYFTYAEYPLIIFDSFTQDTRAYNLTNLPIEDAIPYEFRYTIIKRR